MTPNWVHMQPPVFVPIFDPAQDAIVLTQVHDPGVIPAARNIAAVSGHQYTNRNTVYPRGCLHLMGAQEASPCMTMSTGHSLCLNLGCGLGYHGIGRRIGYHSLG